MDKTSRKEILDKAKELGKSAFKKGLRCTPYADNELMEILSQDPGDKIM